MFLLRYPSFQPKFRVRKTALGQGGFSLMELLVVIALISMLSAASGPALQSFFVDGSNSRPISDLSQTIELARSYAMANHTYVRLSFSKIPAGTDGRSNPSTLLLALYPVSGAVDTTNDTAQALADPAQWRLLAKPVVFNNLIANNALNAQYPSTASDVYPGDASVGATAFPVFQRSGLSVAANATFSASLQVTPSGELQAASGGTPARYVKLPFDRPAPRSGKNPFILRINGLNGNIDVLQKENEIN